MIPKEERYCIDCNKKGVSERRRCKECAKAFNRQRAYKRYKEKGRYTIQKTCLLCNEPMKAWRKEQKYHNSCYLEAIARIKSTRENTSGHYHAKTLVSKLGIVVPKNWCIHHIDENQSNNDPNNLLVLSLKAHNSLHSFLRHQRFTLEKSRDDNFENCWKTLRADLTTAWLETTTAMVIRIGQIGQSAAEPLNSNEHGEGSEAMHEAP